MPKALRLAQVSDCHVGATWGPGDPFAGLKAAIAAIAALEDPIDALLISGDVSDNGVDDEYEQAVGVVGSLGVPVYALPGNHDHSERLRSHLGCPGSDGSSVQYAVDLGDLRLLALDTTLPSHYDGALGPERLAWLERTLGGAPDTPTLLAMHHPPFATGIAHMDRIGLADAAPFAALVRRHPQIERVLAGHLHRPIQARWAGTLASTAPAPCHQVVLDLDPDGEAAFVMEPPGYQLHHYTPGVGLVSHTVTLGRYPGPYPFHGASGTLLD